MNKNLTEIIRNLVIRFVNEKHYIPNEKEMEEIKTHSNKICNILEETQNKRTYPKERIGIKAPIYDKGYEDGEEAMKQKIIYILEKL